ncbi:MAG: phage tail tape measure protein, partial [Candidatus Igneacidithiobacillus chanchocoensis]
MIEAYAISVAAKLEDGVTPGLLRIIDALQKANEAMLDFAANVRNISRLGLSLGRNMEKAAAGATALGDSAAGLTRASYVLDTMATSSAEVAKNMAAARAESRGIGSIGYGVGYRHPANDGEEPGRGWRIGGAATKAAAMTTGGVIAGGIYENAKLQDVVALSMQAQGIPIAQQGATSKLLMKRVEDAYSKYGFTGKGLGDFAHGFLGADFLLHGFAPKDRNLIESTVLPYAANESAIKGVPMDETMKSFIELAHMAGAYTAPDIEKLLPAFINTSLSTDVSIHKLTRQASYAMKPLMQLGISPEMILAMIATMNRAGITNTKAGTWLANAFLNLQPQTLGSGLFKSNPQTLALRQLGLLTGVNHLTYLNKDGSVNAQKALEIAHEHLLKMSPTQAEGALLRALGRQGGRGFSILADSAVLPQLKSILLAQLELTNPEAIRNEILANSPGAKTKLLAANAELTAMNATAGAMDSVNKLLGSALSLAKTTRSFSEKHPVESLGAIAGG